MEKEQLNRLLGEMLKVRLLAPELKEMTYNDLIRRRKVYETTQNQDKERYDELEAEGFTETDSEMKNLLEHTEKLDKLQEELNIIEKVVKEMPLHELNRKIQVYNTRKNILTERKEELEAEGYKEGDKELDDVNKELFSVNELLDTSNKLKELLPNNMIIEMSTPEPTQTESKEKEGKGKDQKQPSPDEKEGEGQTPPPGPGEKGGKGEGQNPPPGPGEKGGEGEGQNPPPGPGEKGGEGEGQTPPPGPGEEEPEGKNPPTGNNENLPVRSFWEIYNDTCTQHVGTIAHKINQLAHMKVLPAKQEDIVHKMLSAALTIVKAPTKVIAKFPNALMGTDKKIKEMQENIDNLPLEEFQVLVQSPDKVNSMFNNAHVKDTFDMDYLNPQFMKQYKVNGAYLDTVRSRLGRERGTAISYYKEQAKKAEERMSELDGIGKQNWTPEQENEYNQMDAIYKQSVAEGQKFQGELDTFDEGAKKKSSSYRNISGWFLAKFNPDNRKENAQMAELSKTRREMARAGNRTEVSVITGQMRRFSKDKTVLKGGQKNYIDRGQYSIESPVEPLNRGPQTKGRLFLGNIALLSSIAGLFKQRLDNRINREAVEEHNQHLQGVNQQNQNFQVSGQVKVADSPTASEAEEAITRQTVEAGWNRAERGDLDATNWNMGSAYHARDVQSHADGAQAAATADSYLQQGDNLGALKTATDYYTKVQGANRSDIANYMSTHPQHDYTAFTFGDSADMSKVYDFFTKGVVPYNTNVNGVMAEMMPALKEGLDLNGVIFAGANALYQGQREGIRDFKKQVKVTPRRQKEEPEQEGQENKQNNHEHENGGR